MSAMVCVHIHVEMLSSVAISLLQKLVCSSTKVNIYLSKATLF